MARTGDPKRPKKYSISSSLVEVAVVVGVYFTLIVNLFLSQPLSFTFATSIPAVWAVRGFVLFSAGVKTKLTVLAKGGGRMRENIHTE